MLADEHARGLHSDGCACSSVERCQAVTVIDFDGLDCRRAAGHPGPHETRGEFEVILWTSHKPTEQEQSNG